MALDGISIFNIVEELKDVLIGSRIDKVYQPERDELIILTRSKDGNKKLLLTANASYPRIHITNISKDNPMTAPPFCMALRKHLTNGRITDICQPVFDRIVNIKIESYNEMGDLTEKTLIIEIMGKRSNIILVDDKDYIIESIKHISLDKSSVRPIMPGMTYVLPPNSDKINPLDLDKDLYLEKIKSRVGDTVHSFIYRVYNGLSPVMATEICRRASYDNKTILDENVDKDLLFEKISSVMNQVKNKNFVNYVVYDEYNRLLDFTSIEMIIYENLSKVKYNSLSEVLEFYYEEKDLVYRVNQKSTDLRKLIENNIERCKKKQKIYIKTLEDIDDRDKLKLYGELITANIYTVEKGSKEITCQNFYDENLSDITIKLNPELSPAENAQKYFSKYNKAKRTFEALKSQIDENANELIYLNTIVSSLSSSMDENDIQEIREELYLEGYLKKKKNQPKGKKEKVKKSKPLHFKSSDGFDIYVGKNNIQNDFLTMKFAKSNDIWLHTKDIPGSHVIIKVEDKNVSEQTLFEAANLSAFYSSGKESSNVPVDYAEKRNVKKPSGSKPGFVIYEKNKTIYINPDEHLVKKIIKIN